MASQFDDTDFIDREFQQTQQTALASEQDEASAEPTPIAEPIPVTEAAPANKATSPIDSVMATDPLTSREKTAPLPTREELEARVGDTQLKLSQLKRQQEQLEQQRASLEETRRRRKEFHDGKAEMVQHLTRGIALLEESELALRRDVSQMNKSLEAFREGLGKISHFSEESWTAENVEVELTRALTAIENARMEWNSARLKWSFLDANRPVGGETKGQNQASDLSLEALTVMPFKDLCRLGFGLTWPLAAIGFLGLVLLIFRAF